jgi:SAM-dependent methyltransferase
MTQAKFDQHPAKGEWLQRLAGLLSGPDQRILDLGCAHGHPARFFCEHPEYVGVDAKSERVDIARQLYPVGTFVQGNYSRFELPRFAVDAVLALETFHYLPPDVVEPTILRIASWLRLDGYFLVYTGRRVASQLLETDLVASAGLRTIELKAGPHREGRSPKSLWLLAQKAVGQADAGQSRAPFGEVVAQAAVAGRREHRRQRAAALA